MSLKDLFDEITFKAYDVYYRLEDLVYRTKDLLTKKTDDQDKPIFDDIDVEKPVKKKPSKKKKPTKKKK